MANGTIEELDDEECVQEKPNDEEDCSVETPCGASDWMATEWSGCEDSCGKFRKLCLYSFNAFLMDLGIVIIYQVYNIHLKKSWEGLACIDYEYKYVCRYSSNNFDGFRDSNNRTFI